MIKLDFPGRVQNLAPVGSTLIEMLIDGTELVRDLTSAGTRRARLETWVNSTRETDMVSKDQLLVQAKRAILCRSRLNMTYIVRLEARS